MCECEDTAQSAMGQWITFPMDSGTERDWRRDKFLELWCKNRSLMPAMIMFCGNSVYEVMQYMNNGYGYDTGDFAAYAVGSLNWIGLHKGAKRLYDSGLTMPIYKALGIIDRRLSVH